MRKVLFVCLGNICRSPMAEMILKELVRQRGLEPYFQIASAGISAEEDGHDIYPPAKRKLWSEDIPVESRRARKITQQDIDEYHDIIVMEHYQKEKILRNYSVSHPEKIYTLLDRDIEDPWYSDDFDTVYEEIYEGCKKFLEQQKNYEQ